MEFDTMALQDATLLMDVFGIPALIADGTHDSTTVRVVFDCTSIDTLGVITDKPQVHMLSADLENLDIKSVVLTIKNSNYRLMKPLADGLGLSLITLVRI